MVFYLCFFFFFKQKTAYEMRISDWSSDVCSSDLGVDARLSLGSGPPHPRLRTRSGKAAFQRSAAPARSPHAVQRRRSEEHTSELQSLMRISYAVFCLKKKKEIIIPTLLQKQMNRKT